MVNFNLTAASSSSWKPRPLPTLRKAVPKAVPWQAFIDLTTGTAKYFNKQVPNCFYDEAPAHVVIEWLDKPPPGTVTYEDVDSNDDDDPYGLFNFDEEDDTTAATTTSCSRVSVRTSYPTLIPNPNPNQVPSYPYS